VVDGKSFYPASYGTAPLRFHNKRETKLVREKWAELSGTSTTPVTVITFPTTTPAAKMAPPPPSLFCDEFARHRDLRCY